MSNIIDKLKSGDLRSIGKVKEVVENILQDNALFEAVFNAISNEDAGVRMRASDAIEKVSRVCPQNLQPFKHELIHVISKIEQQEVRWHVAQMLPRLALEGNEIAQVVDLLTSWADNSKSNIVKVNSLQSLADLAETYVEYNPFVKTKIEELMVIGSAAIRSRGKKLLKTLNKQKHRNINLRL